VRAAPGLPRRVDDPRPDGPRYAAMGNAVSVPVIEWIGRRILDYEGGLVGCI
jgi:site-specific DNA-cytosine methylase